MSTTKMKHISVWKQEPWIDFHVLNDEFHQFNEMNAQKFIDKLLKHLEEVMTETLGRTDNWIDGDRKATNKRKRDKESEVQTRTISLSTIKWPILKSISNLLCVCSTFVEQLNFLCVWCRSIVWQTSLSVSSQNTPNQRMRSIIRDSNSPLALFECVWECQHMHSHFESTTNLKAMSTQFSIANRNKTAIC